MSSEWMSGFTLVRQTDGHDFYEVLASGDEPFLRHRLAVDDYGQALSGGSQTYGFSTLSHHYGGNFNDRRHQARDASGDGFLYTEPFLNSGQGARMQFSVGFSGLIDPEPSFDMISGARFMTPTLVGYGAVEDGRVTVDLEPFEAGSGEGSGRLVLDVSPDGSVTGQLVVSLRNSRIAGHAPEEWLTAEFSFSHIRGVWAGDVGQDIQAIGLTNGSVALFNGVTRQFGMQISILAHDTTYYAIGGE